MFRFILPLLVFVTIARGKDLPSLGVVGGNIASPGQFPFQVSLERNGRQHCGGSIIALDKVLTAAHCVVGVSINSLTVLAGTNNRLSGGVRVRLSSYIPHQNYNDITYANDIAILVLEKALTKSRYIKVAQLPQKNELIYNNQVATVSGWGSEYHKGPTTNLLKYTSVPLWSYEYCTRIIANLPPTQLCAGSVSGQEDSCQGDSGGPLAIGNKVIGIVSFGFGCGTKNVPALYTYVAGQRDWIRVNAGV